MTQQVVQWSARVCEEALVRARRFIGRSLDHAEAGLRQRSGRTYGAHDLGPIEMTPARRAALEAALRKSARV